jgi:predicted Zn-dependent protease
MKKLAIHCLSILGVLGILLGCSSKEWGELAEAGALVAGKTPEEAARYGQTAQTFGEAVLPIDYEQERAVGGGVAVKAFEQFGSYYDDPELVRYVTLVGKAVAAKSPRPDLPYAFAVLDNDTPNAFAGPGGYIFISVGTLQNLHDEAQLASILAHEIAHVCHRHALTTLQRAKLLDGVSQGASLADPQNAAQYSEVIKNLEDALFNKGLDQKYEYQADLSGTDIAAASGYNPWGLREFLGQLEALIPAGASGGWFQTHPSVRERIKRLDVYLNENYSDFRTLPRAKARFQKNVTDRLRASGRL